MVPWFDMCISDESYSSLVFLYKSKWFQVFPIEVSRKYRTMDQYIAQFIQQATSHKDWDEIFIFWFSIGAMIALVWWTILPTKKLFLCAISPYFREDLAKIK